MQEAHVRVLITGGAGNLARHCLEELRAHGHEVSLFDRVRPDQAGRVPWSTDARFILGELTSREDCLSAVEATRAEAVINLGGIPYPTEVAPRPGAPARTVQLPEDETFRVNVMGTFYILDAARRLGATVFVHASTMSTLGISPRIGDLPIPVTTMPVDESHPFWSENTYSLSKVVNEETLLAFSRAYPIRTVALRMMHVYMPHVPGAEDTFRFGQPAQPYTPGNFTVWEYVDARDAAAAYRLAIEAEQLDRFEPFFIATDRFTAEEHRELVKRNYPHLAAAAERMGPDDLILTIRRARERLGYAPTHSWRGAEANARVI
jgi:nucleoside-diphosphate-sugar epimerase